LLPHPPPKSAVDDEEHVEIRGEAVNAETVFNDATVMMNATILLLLDAMIDC
jgi:hypothetical protein